MFWLTRKCHLHDEHFTGQIAVCSGEGPSKILCAVSVCSPVKAKVQKYMPVAVFVFIFSRFMYTRPLRKHAMADKILRFWHFLRVQNCVRYGQY